MHKVRRRNKLRKPKSKSKSNVVKASKPSFAKTKEEALEKEFKFWNTQPVTKISENIGINGVIDQDICNDTSIDPISLPPG